MTRDLRDDPAAAFVLELARRRPDAAALRAETERSGRRDDVLGIADRHALLCRFALLAERQGLAADLPGPVRQRLERFRELALLRDRRQAFVLSQILERLADRDVPCIVLKGPALAERFYEDPGERFAVDTDLLVPRDRLEAAEGVLRTLGFEAMERDRFLRLHFHIPYRPPGTSPLGLVELHWDLSPPGASLRFDLNGWWARAEPAKLRSGNALVPAPVDALGHLGWHAFSRGAPTLRDLAEIAWVATGLATAGGIEEALARSDAAGSGVFTRRALGLASRLWPRDAAGLDVGSARRAGRGWMVRHLDRPETVVGTGNRLWWPYRLLSIWSGLPREAYGTIDLVRDAMRRGGPGPADPVEPHLDPRFVRKLGVLGLAVTACVLPFTFFPSRPREHP